MAASCATFDDVIAMVKADPPPSTVEILAAAFPFCVHRRKVCEHNYEYCVIRIPVGETSLKTKLEGIIVSNKLRRIAQEEGSQFFLSIYPKDGETTFSIILAKNGDDEKLGEMLFRHMFGSIFSTLTISELKREHKEEIERLSALPPSASTPSASSE